MKKNIIFGVAMLVLSTAVLIPILIVSELAVRQEGIMATWLERNGGSYHSPYDQKFPTPWLHIRKPNTTLSYKQPEFDYTISVNSEGLRDTDHPVAKAKDEYRIVALGDSFTEGQGAPFEQTWCQVLEKDLNQDPGPGRTTVIVGGVAGSDPVFEYELLKRRLLKYQPDLVLLVINESDLQDIAARGGLDRFNAKGEFQKKPAPKIEWVWARSHLFRLVMRRIFGYDDYLLSWRERYFAYQKAARCIIGVADTMKKMGQQNGFRLLVVAHPFDYHLHDSNSAYELSGFKSLAAQHHLDYLDLLPLFQKEIGTENDRIREYYWPNDHHCTPKGYRLFAQGVGDKVKTLEGVASRTSP